MTSGSRKVDAEGTPDIKYESAMVLIARVELKELREQLAAKDAAIAESKEKYADLEFVWEACEEQLAAKDAAIAEKDDLLERASEALGRFCSDEGWGQEDMDTMDSIDAHLVRSRR